MSAASLTGRRWECIEVESSRYASARVAGMNFGFLHTVATSFAPRRCFDSRKGSLDHKRKQAGMQVASRFLVTAV